MHIIEISCRARSVLVVIALGWGIQGLRLQGRRGIGTMLCRYEEEGAKKALVGATIMRASSSAPPRCRIKKTAA